MKKKTCLYLSILLLALLPCAVQGETLRYTIMDLPNVTSPRWEQSYKAYGRTINVNVEIEIPRVHTAPVITVGSAPPIEESLVKELEDSCEKALREDLVNSYYFESTDYSTKLGNAIPPVWGKTRDDDTTYDQATMGWASHLLSDYNMEDAYADNNPLTLGEAVEIAKTQIIKLFPNDTLRLTNVAVFDRSFYKKNKEPISEKGYYHLEFHQIFHGIPLMASIHGTFSVLDAGAENYLLGRRGRASASIYDAESFSFVCWFYQEADILYDDVPLLPFDEVKSKVENLINSGYIRMVDNVTLGYVQYDTDDSQVQVLIPSWVVWCEYQQGGPRAEREVPFYLDGMLEDEPHYRPIIINAQTGELIDPESTEYGRCLAPDVIPW